MAEREREREKRWGRRYLFMHSLYQLFVSFDQINLVRKVHSQIDQ